MEDEYNFLDMDRDYYKKIAYAIGQTEGVNAFSIGGLTFIGYNVVAAKNWAELPDQGSELSFMDYCKANYPYFIPPAVI